MCLKVSQLLLDKKNYIVRKGQTYFPCQFHDYSLITLFSGKNRELSASQDKDRTFGKIQTPIYTGISL
jgi:hypothetical protein